MTPDEMAPHSGQIEVLVGVSQPAVTAVSINSCQPAAAYPSLLLLTPAYRSNE